MAPRVALVTDSTACLPAEVVAEHDITVVPLHVVLDGEQRDEATLLALPEDELVTILTSAKKAGTSRPSPAAFLEAYERAVADGAEAIVSIHLSGGLSGTVEGAILAASRASVPVEVVDSRQAGMAVGFSVLAAAAARDDGASATEVAAVARSTAQECVSSFYVDNLDMLRRGGRVTVGAHLVGSALAIKPILGIEDGVIESRAKVRTAARATDRLVSDAVEAIEAAPAGADVAVQSLGADDRAAAVLTRLQEACPEASAARYRLGPVLGAHVGPGTVAVVVSARAAR